MIGPWDGEFEAPGRFEISAGFCGRSVPVAGDLLQSIADRDELVSWISSPSRRSPRIRRGDVDTDGAELKKALAGVTLPRTWRWVKP